MSSRAMLEIIKIIRLSANWKLVDDIWFTHTNIPASQWIEQGLPMPEDLEYGDHVQDPYPSIEAVCSA